MNRIDFKLIVSKKDYRTAVYFNLFKNKISNIFFILVTIISIVNLSLHYLNIIKLSDFYFYINIIFIFVEIFIFISTELFIMSFIKSDKLLIDKESIISIDEEKIISSKEHSNNTIKWDEIYKVYEIKSHFLLYTNTQQAVIISKSQMPNGSIEILREFLIANLSSKYKKI